MFEDYDEYDYEEIEPAPCPRCAGQDTDLQVMHSARCWHEDSDSGDEGIFIQVGGYHCNDCEHVFEVHYGRPLNVDCECD